jgi:hypothetical protein
MSPLIRIDGKGIEAPEGSNVLGAALEAGARIPTMCYMAGYGHVSSCMVCVVKDAAAGKLIPACAAPVSTGLDIETNSEEVREARKAALELLLGEHVGDCEGPCRMGCPAHMEIPLMIRRIGGGRQIEAIAAVKEDIPFPGVMGRICPAPCQKVCRRRELDEPVSIRALERQIADADLATGAAYVPPAKEGTGKRVAIVGAGPAGLSAAYFLLRDGHECEVFDENGDPGGGLRSGVSRDLLPLDVLDAEIDAVRRLGAAFTMGTHVGRDVSLEDLAGRFDAVVVAAGEGSAELGTDRGGVFLAGPSAGSGRMAIRAVANGRKAALSAGQFLRGIEVTGMPRLFNSRIGKLQEGEIDEFVPDADPSRCLHCDCLKRDTCRLRTYAMEYGASPEAYRSPERKRVEKTGRESGVIYEPGKCIKCGLCVRITEKAGQGMGLTFIGRGFDVRVGVPFSGTLREALGNAAAQCVEACPTGALAYGKAEA